MKQPKIAVLDYGMGNLRSVQRALERVGARPVVTSKPREAERCAAAVLPGVGAFGACMTGLVRTTGLDRAVIGFVDSGRPVLGVCLGLQVLFERSEERSRSGQETVGLEYIGGTVRKLPPSVKVPHMGWNEIEWVADHPYVRGIPSGTRFYFVHSYAVDADPRYTVGVTDYGRPFAAALTHDVFFATQFHPEKSGEPGLAIYENFVKEVSST